MLVHTKSSLLFATSAIFILLIMMDHSVSGVDGRALIRAQRLFKKQGEKTNTIDLATSDASVEAPMSMTLSDTEPVSDYSSIQKSLISRKQLGEF